MRVDQAIAEKINDLVTTTKLLDSYDTDDYKYSCLWYEHCLVRINSGGDSPKDNNVVYLQYRSAAGGAVAIQMDDPDVVVKTAKIINQCHEDK